MHKKGLLLVFLLWGMVLPLLAQAPINNQRCKWIAVSNMPQQLDSLTLLPSTITLHHPKQQQFTYDYNYTTNLFTLTGFPPPDSVSLDTLGTMQAVHDSLLVCFRVMPLNLTQPAFKRDITKLEKTSFQKGAAGGYQLKRRNI
ncbi:hypothetical protein GCM10028895_45360 [Pontibacter rugosus]